MKRPHRKTLSTALAVVMTLQCAFAQGTGFDPAGGLGARFEAYQESTTYEVVPGDTLYGIALRFFGDGFRWPDIFEANRELISNPDLIYPGQVFRVPGGQRRTIPTVGTHRVSAGETLSEISQRYFGSPDYWQDIYAANADRIRDPANLEEGLELRIPGEVRDREKPKDRPGDGPGSPDPGPRPEAGSNPRLEELTRRGAVTTRSPQFSRWVSEALNIAESWSFPNVSNQYGDRVTRADFLRAILYIESRGVHSQPGGSITRSYAGAMGFMQLMPRTADGLGVNPSDPRQNLLGGTRYIGETLRGPNTQNPGDGPLEKLIKAAAGYNRGPYASELRDKSWDAYVRTSSVTENVQYGILTKMCLGVALTSGERSWIMQHRRLSSAGVDDMARSYYRESRSLF